MRCAALGGLLAIACACAAAAQTVERAVTPGGAGPNRLTLDAAFLARAQPFRVAAAMAADGRVAIASGGAGDLRLVDRDGKEVQYLLIAPAVEPEWRGARLLRVAPSRFASGFEADLEASLPIDRLRLDGLPAPFLKRVQVEGSGDRSHWTLLVGAATLFDLPNDGLELTTLDFAAGRYRYLRVTWDDRSSARMPLPRRVDARVASATRGPAPLRTGVSVEKRPSEPGKSRFRLLLPGPHLPIIAIELSVDSGNVMRTARVSEGRLDGSTVVPTELGTAMLRRSVRDGVAAASLRIPIAPPNEAQLELVVDDGDNPPLHVTGATAIFATLPFVFFESDGRPIVARYGDERLAAPRYDLEAERDRVRSLDLAAAHWDSARTLVASARDSMSAIPVKGSAIDPATFRYARAIPASGAGLTIIPIDVAALAHGAPNEARIATADGHQVPFLVERLDEPLSVGIPPLERLTGRGDPASRSRYRVRLPYAGLPASRLVLHTDARVFEREIAVEMSPPVDVDPRARSGPITIARTTWRQANPDWGAPALTVDLPSLPVSELQLIVDEGDNAPLSIRDASLLLPAYRLRFIRSGATPLTLLYGQSDLAPPRYDLALLAPRLLGARATDVLPGPEHDGGGVTGVTPTIVFWCALALAVLALLVLIARLLRPGAGAEPTTSSPTSSASQ